MEVMENYMTIQEYMRIKEITRQTVYNWLENGKLESKKILTRTVVREKQ